ncbi:MAG: hypothetical protein V1706_15055 [Pseudomonadota bacterium]
MTDEIKARKSISLFEGKNDKETFENAAALFCGPEFAAFRVIFAADGQGEVGKLLDAAALMDHLRDQKGALQSGDMKQVEAMLMNQATALQTLFARLTERGFDQSTMSNLESFMRLALRAQNQCRSTLETLSAIKNPPVVFAKQANIANGPQQVNNEASRARENKIPQNQLLEDTAHERLDFEATPKTGANDQEMATMGKVNRAKDRTRQAGKRHEGLQGGHTEIT